MPITIPNPSLIRPTTTPTPALPGTPKVAMDLPGPVKVATSGAASAKGPLIDYALDPADGTLGGYYGFSVSSGVPLAPDDVAVGIVKGCIVDGFAGVSPGVDVFLNVTARPTFATDPTWSGLTHTVVTGRPRVGVGISTTKIYFD